MRNGAMLLALLLIAATASAQDAVSVATSAVTDIYVRPLRLKQVVLSAKTDYFEPGSKPDTVFIDVFESRTCCTPTPNAPPLLSFSVFVRNGRLRNITATGPLIDAPKGRSLSNPDDVEREVIAAIKQRTKWNGVASSGVKRVNDHEVRRIVFKAGAKNVPESDRMVILDLRARLPRMIELP